MNKSLNFYFQYLLKAFKKYLTIFEEYVLLTFLLGFICGFIFVDNFYIPLTVVLIFLFIKIRITSVIIVVIAFLLGVFVNYNYAGVISSELLLSNKNVSLEGYITEPPTIGKYKQEFFVDVGNYSSDFLVVTNKYPVYNVGTKIKFNGDIVRLEDEDIYNGYRTYLESKSVYLKLNYPSIYKIESFSVFEYFSDLKSELSNKLRKNTKFLNASLINGMVFGSKESLPEDFEEKLRNTGTSHVVSASGYNVVMVHVFLSYIERYLGRKNIIILSVFGVILYIFLIGVYIIPAVRAGLMLVIALLGKLYGRKVNVFITLLLSMSLIILFKPNLIYNVSFQLSSFATFGLIAFTDTFKVYLKKLGLNDILLDGVSSTIAATVSTIPISLFHFGSISIISILVNTVVLPLVPIITLFSIFTLVFGFGFISNSLFNFLNLVSDIFISLIEMFNSIPINVSDNLYFSIVFFVFLISIFVYYHYNNVSNNTRDSSDN